MEENKITISKYEYDNLKETKLKYEILMNHIFYGDSTGLSYDKKDLELSVRSLVKAIKVLEPIWYEQVVRKYKLKKEENNNDTNWKSVLSHNN